MILDWIALSSTTHAGVRNVLAPSVQKSHQRLEDYNSGEQTFSGFGDNCLLYRINTKVTIPYFSGTNLAEDSMRETMVGIWRVMQ
jgi:hypothetical protein